MRRELFDCRAIKKTHPSSFFLLLYPFQVLPESESWNHARRQADRWLPYGRDETDNKAIGFCSGERS
jgi:hypothetical protein